MCDHANLQNSFWGITVIGSQTGGEEMWTWLVSFQQIHINRSSRGEKRIPHFLHAWLTWLIFPEPVPSCYKSNNQARKGIFVSLEQKRSAQSSGLFVFLRINRLMWLIRMDGFAVQSSCVYMTLGSCTSLAASRVLSLSLSLWFSQETRLDKAAWAIKA